MSVDSGLRPVRLLRLGLPASTQLATTISTFGGFASIGLGRSLRAHTRAPGTFLTSSDAFPSLFLFLVLLLPSLVKGDHGAQIEIGRCKVVRSGKVLGRSYRRRVPRWTVSLLSLGAATRS